MMTGVPNPVPGQSDRGIGWSVKRIGAGERLRWAPEPCTFPEKAGPAAPRHTAGMQSVWFPAP
jgi:hypothetical protein